MSTPQSESVTPPRDGLDIAVTAGDLEATPGTGARVRTAIRPTKWSQRLSGRLATLEDRWRYPLAVYFLSRVLYLGTALVATVVPQPGRSCSRWITPRACC